MKLVALIALASFSAFAAPVPQIQVQGKCDMKVIPDRGRITFTAEHLAMDQKVAVSKTTTQINNLKEAIKSLKLDDLELKNSQYNVYQERVYEKDKLVNKGYRASLSLEVETSSIPRLGEAIEKASTTGITNVGQLVTFLSLEKSQSEYLKCLDVAADDARAKAQQLAKRLGFKIGDVIALNETPSIPQYPVPMPEMRMMKTMSDSAPAQIEAGTQNFSTNIIVTFGIK